MLERVSWSSMELRKHEKESIEAIFNMHDADPLLPAIWTVLDAYCVTTFWMSTVMNRSKPFSLHVRMYSTPLTSLLN